MENFGAESEVIGYLPLQQPPKKLVVLVPNTWINPISPTAVGGPLAEILLHPDGQINLRVVIPKTAAEIGGR